MTQSVGGREPGEDAQIALRTRRRPLFGCKSVEATCAERSRSDRGKNFAAQEDVTNSVTELAS